MLFSFTFEIGLLILGLLYIGDMYFESFISLIQTTKDMEKDDKDKQDEKQLIELTKHLYS